MERQGDKELHKWLNDKNVDNNNPSAISNLNMSRQSGKMSNNSREPSRERKKFYLEDDQRNFSPSLNSGIKCNSASVAHLLEPDSFKNELDNWKVHPDFKSMVEEMHTNMHDANDILKMDKMQLLKEYRDQRALLERAQSDNTLYITKINNKDDELKRLADDVQRYQLWDEQGSVTRIETEKALAESRARMYDKEQELNREKKDNEKLVAEKNKLLIESTTQKSKVEEQTIQIQLLEKALSINDNALVGKLKLNDDRMSAIAEESKKVTEYGAKLADLYKVMESNSSQQKMDIEDTAKKVASAERCVNALGQEVHNLYGMIKEISCSLKELNAVVGYEMVDEIKNSQQTRTELAKENSALISQQNEMKSTVLDNMQDFRKDMTILKDIKKEGTKYLLLLTLFILACISAGKFLI